MYGAELRIGAWYRRPNGSLFEIVAIDEQASTVEVQHFDGTIDEIDQDVWPTLYLEPVRGPDDWLGSVDMDPEDFTGEATGEMPLGWHDPREHFDLVDRDLI